MIIQVPVRSFFYANKSVHEKIKKQLKIDEKDPGSQQG
jgi:hypothetical protein